MRLIDADKLGLTNTEILMCNGDYKEALKMILEKIEKAPTVFEWTPVKTRPLTEEEKKEYIEEFGHPWDVPEVYLDFTLPEDDQDILITYEFQNGERGVAADVCCRDWQGCSLQNFDDWENVVAWAPFPKPYTEEDKR